MRTAIFLGLTAVADATRQDWLGKDERIIQFATNGLGLADVGGFEIQMFKLSTNVK